MEGSIFSFEKQDGHAPICVSPSSMSNHHPIYANVYVDNNADSSCNKKKVSFNLNTSLLNDEESDDAIRMVTSLCKLYNQGLSPKDM